MKRRDFLLGAAAATLARPAIGGAAKTLVFIPQSPLPVSIRVDQRHDHAERRLHDLRCAVRPRRRHEPEAADAGGLRRRGRRQALGHEAARKPVVPRRRARAGARLHGVIATLDEARSRRRDAGSETRCTGSAGRPHDRGSAEQEIPASAETAVEIPDRRGDGAGANCQRHRSVQADDGDRSAAARSGSSRTNT